MLNVPNTITLIRILLVPVFLSFIAEGENKLALIIFVVAGVTDGVDGAVARLTNSRTVLGAHLDPLADKLLLVSAYISLGILAMVPIQLVIMVIVRDVVILGGFLFSAAVVGRSMEMRPSIWGKGSTFFQIFTVGLVLLDRSGWATIPGGVLAAIFIVTAAATLVSGIGYVVDGIRWYQASETPTGSAGV